MSKTDFKKNNPEVKAEHNTQSCVWQQLHTYTHYYAAACGETRLLSMLTFIEYWYRLFLNRKVLRDFSSIHTLCSTRSGALLI